MRGLRPLFISPPRTRSAILYESASPFIVKNTDLLPSVGHSEPFLLHTYNNSTIREMHPVLGDESLEYTFTTTRQYKNNHESVLKKLEMFRVAKDQGREYNFKATLNITTAMDEFLEVFGDRDIILTLRKNPVDIFYSTFYAMSIGSFHARNNSYEEHHSKVKKVTVNLDLVDWMVEMVSGIYKLSDRYPAVYYEDVETQDQINNCLSNILDTNDWMSDVPMNLPIKVNNNYVDLIDNFEDLQDAVEIAMRAHFV